MLIGYKPQFHAKILDGTKKHTIRTDAHDRWHAGMKMHQSAGVRTKQYRLLRMDTCTGTQTIEILWNRNIFFLSKAIVYVDCESIGYFYPEKIQLTDKKVIELAINDGFETVQDFFKWFNDDYEGKIIHWTNLRY